MRPSNFAISRRASRRKAHIMDHGGLRPLSSRAAKRGGFKRGGFPIWTCPSFFVLFCPFWDFPDFSGIFPICSGTVRGFSRSVLFLFLGLLKSTYEEQSRKGPRHNLEPSRKKWENCKKGKGHQNRAPSLLEPRVLSRPFRASIRAPRASTRASIRGPISP